MASNVVNLNRFRKKKQREDKAKEAEVNRRKHGRTKAQKERELADRERARRLLGGKRLEPRAADLGGDGDGDGAEAVDRAEEPPKSP